MAEVSFYVSVPRDAEPHGYSLPTAMLVGDAAVLVSDQLGYTSGYPSFAGEDGRVLDRSASLAEAGIFDMSTVELVDVGGAA